MVRTVNTKTVRSLSKGQRALLLPGSTGAEPWALWTLGGKGPEMVQVCQSPLDNRLRKLTTLALPVSQVFCLPLWLNETDAKLFAGMIPLQLELRGLQPRGSDGAVFDWTVVATEGTRTLIMIGVLPAMLNPDIHAEAYESFDLSARYLPFPEDALTLWREQDRLCAAITRGKDLIYYQALADGPITPHIAQDLICARTTLVMQDIVTPLKNVMAWTHLSAEEIVILQSTLQLPVEQEEIPSPVTPRAGWKLTPAVVGEARRSRAARQWQMRALAIGLVLYLCVVAWMSWRYLSTSSEVATLQKWQTDHAAQLELVQNGRAEWKEVAPVVDTKSYPLELLLEASKMIPADQLHLTRFEAGNDHILIKGEAKNVSGAYTFWNKLKADPFFSSYTLTMGNPRPLPNDLAQFQIEGAHAGN